MGHLYLGRAETSLSGLVVSHRSATGPAFILRRLGESGQLLLEGLLRGAVAEAAPGRGVERRHQTGKPVHGQLGGVGLPRRKAADPAIGVLDRAFLPGAVWVTEPGL